MYTYVYKKIRSAMERHLPRPHDPLGTAGVPSLYVLPIHTNKSLFSEFSTPTPLYIGTPPTYFKDLTCKKFFILYCIYVFGYEGELLLRYLIE